MHQSSKYLNENTDERDQGQLILTHMYLLLGCSIPLWIGSMFLFDQHSYYQKLQQQEENNAYLTSSLDTGIIYVCLLSGIVSVGVGDAVGSIVGKTSDEKYKIKWPNSNKSLQGKYNFNAKVVARLAWPVWLAELARGASMQK